MAVMIFFYRRQLMFKGILYLKNQYAMLVGVRGDCRQEGGSVGVDTGEKGQALFERLHFMVFAVLTAGAMNVRAAASADPKKRVVITGMGMCSVFGNDPEHFYNQLLEGVSGIDTITRFDASEFPTNFAGQIKDFDNEGLIDKKNARRYDDCLSYGIVAAKKALRNAGIEKEANPEAHESLDKSRVMESWSLHA